MKKIKLNKDAKNILAKEGYKLNPKEQYCICLNDEMELQSTMMMSFQTTGGSQVLDDYNNWLRENKINVNDPDIPKDLVKKYYGVKPLWSTNLSQGIVVKDENDDTYYIVMECSKLNVKFKYAQIILTLGGVF